MIDDGVIIIVIDTLVTTLYPGSPPLQLLPDVGVIDQHVTLLLLLGLRGAIITIDGIFVIVILAIFIIIIIKGGGGSGPRAQA